MSESQSQVTDKIYILGKRFDVSASQQVVMKLSKGVEQAIDHLGDTEDENIKSDIAIAQKYLEDAARSKQLLDKMYQKAKETSKAVILAKIQEMTEIITSTVHEQLEKSVNEMVTCGETLCPAVMQEHLKKDILETAKHKSQLSENYVQEWMEKQAGSAIANKASELHLSAATAICNKIIDDILDSLAKSRRQLNMHLSEISQQEKIKRDQEQKKEDEEKEVEDEEEEVDDEEKEVEDEEKEDSVEKKDDEENEENDVVSSPLKEPGIENVMSIMRKRLSQRPKSIIITDSTKLIHDVSPMETPETTPTMPVKALMRVKDNSSSDDEPDIGEQRKTTPNGNDNISQDSSFGASSGDELGHGKEISVTPVSPVTPIKHVSPEVIRPPSASPIEDFGDLPTQHTPLNRITSGRPRPNRNIKIRPTKPIVAIAEEAKVNNTGTVTTNAIVENQNLGEEKNINVTEGVETFFSTNNVLSPENVRPAQVNTNVTSPKSPDKKKMAKKDKKEKKGKKDKKDKDEKDKKDEKKDKKEKKEDKDKKEKSFLSGFRKLPNPFSRQPKTPPREMSPSSESIRSRSSISPSTEESPQRNEHTKVKTTYSSPIPDDNLYEPVEPDICKEKPVEKKKPSLEQETIQNDHPPRDHEGEKEDGKKDQQEDEPVLITAKKTVGAVAMPGMGAVLDSGILAEMKQKQKLSENSKNSEPDETKKAEQQLDVKKPLAKESVSDGILDEMKRKQKLSENRKNSAPDETKQDKQIDSKKAPAKDSPTELINVPKTETHVNITTKQSSSPKAVRQPGSPKPSPRKLSKGNEAEGEPGELKSSPLLLRRASGSPKTISPATSPKPKHRMLLSKQTDSAPKTAAALYSEVKAKSAEAVNPTPRPRSSQVITTRPLSSVPATTTDKESKDSVSPVPRPRSRAISGAHPPTEVPSSPTSKPAKPAKPAKPPPIMPKPVTKRPSSRIGGSPPVVRKTPPSLRAEGEVVREKQKFSVKERANIYSKGGVPKHTPETSLPLTANTEADSGKFCFMI
uniref:Muscle M-line assembly protein unc-89-like n=1 Tax=Saccoglossus kowalevskii TaxID=10224 RepID=A0ABM0LV13_SACKO|nr:PREDICTED: muscle M-line assembly protein unc-89-like [Saccoglossus kowalevskii]